MSCSDMRDKLGSSPSPAIDRVLQNNAGTNVKNEYATPQAALADKHTSHPVEDISKTR